MTERSETDDAGIEDASAERFEPGPERVALLRAVADDVRRETSEGKRLANVLYRASDLYDGREDASSEEIVRNVRTILEVEERVGLDR